MDYVALRDADAALGIADPAEAAAALRAQIVTVTGQPVRWIEAKRIARAVGDWPKIVTRSRGTATLPPQTLADFAILAAINAVESEDGDTIDPGDPIAWPQWQAGMVVLHSSGDLSDAALNAISALTTKVSQKWDPQPTEHDVTGARNL